MTPVQIIQQDGMLIGFNKYGQRSGMGADDKAGVFICLELLERMDNVAVALFAAEEATGVRDRRARTRNHSIRTSGEHPIPPASFFCEPYLVVCLRMKI